MPKVYRITDFKRKHGEYVSDMFKSDDRYIFIANETYFDKSFIVSDPKYTVKVLKESGRNEDADFIEKMLEMVKLKVSQKYRDIRNKR